MLREACFVIRIKEAYIIVTDHWQSRSWSLLDSVKRMYTELIWTERKKRQASGSGITGTVMSVMPLK